MKQLSNVMVEELLELLTGIVQAILETCGSALEELDYLSQRLGVLL